MHPFACLLNNCSFFFLSFSFLWRHDNGWSPRIWTSHSGSHQPENWRFPTCDFYLEHSPAAFFSPQCPFQRAVHTSVLRRTWVSVCAQRSAPEKVSPRNSHASRPWEKNHPEFTWRSLVRQAMPAQIRITSYEYFMGFYIFIFRVGFFLFCFLRIF